MPRPIEIRRIDPATEGFAYLRAKLRSYGEDMSEERLERWRSIIEPDRTIAALMDGHVVGTATAYSFVLGLPVGRSVRAAGIAGISVLPTHRGRGVLRAMLDFQLTDIGSRGEAFAVLRASDPGLYGQFGFGLATEERSVELQVDNDSRPSRPPADIELEYVDDEPAMAMSQLHELLPLGVGDVRRSLAHWQRIDPDGSLHHISARRHGAIVGHLAYRTTPRQLGERIRLDVDVRACIASDDEVRMALWDFATSLHLVATVRADGLAPDHPWLPAPGARVAPTDGIWVRAMDIPAALEGRDYHGTGTFALRVQEDDGRDVGAWQLEVRDRKGVVRQLDATSDRALVLTRAELSALCLGSDVALRSSRSGTVRPELAPLVELFRTPGVPHCSLRF